MNMAHGNGLLKCIGILILLFVSCYGFAQPKYEKELRITKTEVPQTAVHFLAELGIENKPTWYQEIGLRDTSIEAKTKHHKQYLSIEFSSQGAFEDLEIRISKKDLPPETAKAISEECANSFQKYQMKRIQLQLKGSISALKSYLDRGHVDTALKKAYEVVVAVKEDGSYRQYEYLFSDQGAVLQKTRIVRHISDNLEY